VTLNVDSRALESGIQVLKLSGSMRLGKESQHFESLVNGLLKSQKNRIIVDMSGVGYVDSSGIGILVACHSNVTAAGGQFRLTGVVARVATLFSMTGVDRILKVDATSQDAVRALGASA
jgi:anti-sigma B factor antagonist